MQHSIRPLTDALRAAREKKALSQRAFSALLGITQGRLSRIETGATDLRTSSLLELARALDLEVMLVPRQLMPAVNSLIDQTASETAAAPRPAYRLDEDDDNA
jgi:transcriptional regulator with XRE-family HTH domain